MTEATGSGGRQPLAPAELERWLWAYEAGLLDPEEEAQLAWHLAGDPAIQARLGQIRQSFDRVAARSGLTLTEARARSTRAPLVPASLRAALTQAGTSLVACFLRAQEGLEAMIQETSWALGERPAAAALLGPDSLAASVGGTPRASQMREIVGPEGMSLRVVNVASQGVSLHLQLPTTWPDRMIELRRLTEQAGGIAPEELDRQLTRQGRCQFSDCPAGALELLIPEHPAVVVFVSECPGE